MGQKKVLFSKSAKKDFGYGGLKWVGRGTANNFLWMAQRINWLKINYSHLCICGPLEYISHCISAACSEVSTS